jgi:hypothetical protein
MEVCIPPEEAIRRIQEAIQPNTLRVRFRTKGKAFLGSVSRREFFIRQFQQGVRNSYEPECYGRVQPTPAGCMITAHFRISPGILILTVLWFSGMALVEILLAYSSLSDIKSAWALLPIAALLAGGYALVRLSQYMGESNKKAITNLLLRLFLDVRTIPAPSTPKSPSSPPSV